MQQPAVQVQMAEAESGELQRKAEQLKQDAARQIEEAHKMMERAQAELAAAEQAQMAARFEQEELANVQGRLQAQQASLAAEAARHRVGSRGSVRDFKHAESSTNTIGPESRSQMWYPIPGINKKSY